MFAYCWPVKFAAIFCAFSMPSQRCAAHQDWLSDVLQTTSSPWFEFLLFFCCAGHWCAFRSRFLLRKHCMHLPCIICDCFTVGILPYTSQFLTRATFRKNVKIRQFCAESVMSSQVRSCSQEGHARSGKPYRSIPAHETHFPSTLGPVVAPFPCFSLFFPLPCLSEASILLPSSQEWLSIDL